MNRTKTCSNNINVKINLLNRYSVVKLDKTNLGDENLFLKLDLCCYFLLQNIEIFLNKR